MCVCVCVCMCVVCVCVLCVHVCVCICTAHNVRKIDLFQLKCTYVLEGNGMEREEQR